MRSVKRTRAQLLLWFALQTAATSASAVTGLVYYGGPVISNAQVVMVNWGDSVPMTVQNSLPAFYSDIVQSDYWTALREYATTINGYDGLAGSNQQIGLGSFVGPITIVPAQCPTSTSCTISDADIGAELENQITNLSVLPAPTTDDAGHVNTVYMVHFNPNVKIVVQGINTSCQQFCGDFTNFSHAGLNVTAGLLPDQSGSCGPPGCGGAGSGASYLDIETFTSSAILANIVTDPLAPSAATIARPLAWLDPNNGQVADICLFASPAGDSKTVVANGNSYKVGRLWSNAANTCVIAGNQFVVHASAGDHGTISPAGPLAVNSSAQAEFTVTADDGFDTVVTGTCGGLLSGTTFTTNLVMADCSVVANFSDVVFADGFDI